MKGSNGNESMALRVGRGLGHMAAPVVAMEARFWGLLAKVGAPLPLLNLLKRIARLVVVVVLAMASAQYLFPVLVFLFALYAVCALASSANGDLSEITPVNKKHSAESDGYRRAPLKTCLLTVESPCP